MQSLLWRQLVIDFGHELVTAIHMPLMWSNERPNAEEYTAAFHRVSLSASKVLYLLHWNCSLSQTTAVVSNQYYTLCVASTALSYLNLYNLGREFAGH